MLVNVLKSISEISGLGLAVDSLLVRLRVVTSESKKPGQNAVVYHYCNLSRFFLTQTLYDFASQTKI